ncbi:glycosyltransferase family 4 protein [Nitrosococcus wardiae]|uniref:Glycosyltransferase family 1 protein n=1 Tax=Nitrosococcus wardiae TaxID=1814290 RepID=A0A4P7BVM4_9GAMM|nr:glycosyltransferase family 1 protein [Nitrosococcus wardiae]QBQ53229.1 glycosyltransferase family 1 protein [Nitrosococcus wardiae]
MRILIVSDAWRPQTNGVVTTLSRTQNELEQAGHSTFVIGPDRFRTLPCPTYPEISLALNGSSKLPALIEELQPQAIHIATEGPLGLAARKWCLRHGHPFTTSFHTRFPEYIKLRTGLPLGVGYRYLRWFHGASTRTMVATHSLQRELFSKRFRNLVLWPRAVDTHLFYPRDKNFLKHSRPLFMYVGRVAVEKNIRAFLRLQLPGTKIVVGDGPQLDKLSKEYPEVVFTGVQKGKELASHFAAADVLVFPSRTDTFGLVMLEAMACGVPVAAYPVPGPIDVVINGETGYLNEDLAAAALSALSLDPHQCRVYAEKFTWPVITQQFLNNLAPISYQRDGEDRETSPTSPPIEQKSGSHQLKQHI